uniref:Uncharacterized protein n=1 Tax=Amphimedon queenslandica TaxID=400682 RepID=A0A1X7SLM2_AMPQE
MWKTSAFEVQTDTKKFKARVFVTGELRVQNKSKNWVYFLLRNHNHTIFPIRRCLKTSVITLVNVF